MPDRIHVQLNPSADAALKEVCDEFYGLPKTRVINRLIVWFASQNREVKEEILSTPERRPSVGAVATKKKKTR